MLDAVAPILEPLGLAVPRIELCGWPSARYPYRWSAYRKLEGDPARHRSSEVVRRADNARRLGRAIGRLQQIDIGPLVERGVSMDDAKSPERYRPRALAAAQALRAVLPPERRARVERFLERDAEAAPAPPRGVARVLRHNDLYLDHLLLDTAGHVSGIIDWADASIGDPAGELSGLWVQCGESFVREMLDAAHPPFDEDGLMERVRRRGRYGYLVWTAASLQQGEPLDFWLARFDAVLPGDA